MTKEIRPLVTDGAHQQEGVLLVEDVTVVPQSNAPGMLRTRDTAALPT